MAIYYPWVVNIASRELTHPIMGKGKSSSKGCWEAICYEESVYNSTKSRIYEICWVILGVVLLYNLVTNHWLLTSVEKIMLANTSLSFHKSLTLRTSYLRSPKVPFKVFGFILLEFDFSARTTPPKKKVLELFSMAAHQSLAPTLPNPKSTVVTQTSLCGPYRNSPCVNPTCHSTYLSSLQNWCIIYIYIIC